jgi:hypothetical protein
MVILAYRFRLESAARFPDDRCPADVAWAGPASTQIVSDEARRLDLHVARVRPERQQRTVLARSHTSRLTLSQQENREWAERISTPPTKPSGEQQWPLLV